MACAALSMPNVRARRAAVALLSGFLLAALLVNRQAYDLQHIGAALIGAICWRVFRRSSAPITHAPAPHEAHAEDHAQEFALVSPARHEPS